MLSTGKLHPDFLQTLLQKISSSDPRLILGPGIGEDAAVIDNGEDYLVVTSDPITFTADNIGWYAVTINVNDIAVMGGKPEWFLPVILLPENISGAEIGRIFTEINAACEKFGITVIGGHTEVTPGLGRTVVIGQMIGRAAKNRLIDKRSIKEGDAIYLAGGIAIEAVSIIAREKPEIMRGEFPESFIKEALNYIHDPGICVLEDAELAANSCKVSGMHDPTEGGLTGGLWELSERAGCGFEIIAENIPVLSHCIELCDLFGFDPLRLIASGALIIVISEENARSLETAFRKEGRLLSAIGKMTNIESGRVMLKNGEPETVELPVVDEINKLWD